VTIHLSTLRGPLRFLSFHRPPAISLHTHSTAVGCDTHTHTSQSCLHTGAPVCICHCPSIRMPCTKAITKSCAWSPVLMLSMLLCCVAWHQPVPMRSQAPAGVMKAPVGIRAPAASSPSAAMGGSTRSIPPMEDDYQNDDSDLVMEEVQRSIRVMASNDRYKHAVSAHAHTCILTHKHVYRLACQKRSKFYSKQYSHTHPYTHILICTHTH
jgi:hypothetical protein